MTRGVSRRGVIAGLFALPLRGAEPVEVRSPDGNVEMRLTQGPDGATRYAVLYKRITIIEGARLGFKLDDGTTIANGWRLRDVKRRSVKTSWRQPYGERVVVPEQFSEAVVALETGVDAMPRIELSLRAYNEGAALRYTLHRDRAVNIAAELTEFRFPVGAVGFEEHGTEGEYSQTPVVKIRPNCERPLTVRLPSGVWASVTEAALDDYPRMLLSVVDGAIAASLSGLASVPGGRFETPWRAIVLGAKPGDLLERNYLVLNLNAPSQIADTSWIQPGKVIREVTLSTRGGKACVDFAVRHGLQYIEYDAGWYGHEYDDAADARTISPDPKRIANIPDHGGLDLKEVIRYGRERNIGVLLYVNRRALERQIDEILPLYASWGVRGVKYGFVNVGPQQWTAWLMEAVRKAARHRLVVDIHDSYRPTGFSRTFPNLLTQEGIRGNEHMPTASHNCTLPFTRYVAGAGDYTICYYTNRIKTTHAHQLALAAMNYSPLQFLFWYDRPDAYQGEPEVELFRHLPVVWDETRVIDGDPGVYATIARRSGREWYVGSITNESAREADVALSFLEPGRKYTAHVYSDDSSVDTQTHVRVEQRAVTNKSTLPVKLIASGGQALRIVPA